MVDSVARWLALNQIWLGRDQRLHLAVETHQAAQIWIAPPPKLSNQPPPQELDLLLHIAHKFNIAGRDARNRDMGRAGADHVFAHKRATLQTAGRGNLAC